MSKNDTTIRLSTETRNALATLRDAHNYDTISELLERMIDREVAELDNDDRTLYELLLKKRNES